MKDINVTELTEENVISADEAAAVKGGPAYLKLGDIKGESRAAGSVPTEDFSLNYERIRF